MKFLVTTGLDPVVHAEIKPAILGRLLLSMDARVKPGHDEKENFRRFNYTRSSARAGTRVMRPLCTASR
jgi:hypothetical protein